MAWTVFLLMRLIILIRIYSEGTEVELFFSNLILGFPSTLVILIASYIYGIWRLNRLKGPGVEEFLSQAEPPWKGQKKGF